MNYQVHTLAVLALKITAPKIRNYCDKFYQKGYIPLSDFFTKLGIDRESEVPTLMLTFTTVALKCGLIAAKYAKIVVFGIK